MISTSVGSNNGVALPVCSRRRCAAMRSPNVTTTPSTNASKTQPTPGQTRLT